MGGGTLAPGGEVVGWTALAPTEAPRAVQVEVGVPGDFAPSPLPAVSPPVPTAVLVPAGVCSVASTAAAQAGESLQLWYCQAGQGVTVWGRG